jgi:hypothetical protein
MTAFQIVGAVVMVATGTDETLTLTQGTNSITGNKNISVLKIDNPDLVDNLAITFSLTAPPTTLDLNNCVIVPANGTVFVQVAPANHTGPVYVHNTAGGAATAYVQPVALIN